MEIQATTDKEISKPSSTFWSKAQKIIFGINIVLILIATIGILTTIAEIDKLRERHGTKPTESQTQLSKALRCYGVELKLSVQHYSIYWILQNYVVGTKSKNAGCVEYVTFTTHARDINTLRYLPSLVANWHSPVSIALFAPGGDFNRTLRAIQYARNCLNESILITEYVTFHIIFPHDHMPEKVPHGAESPLSWPYDCNDKSINDYKSASKTYAYKHSLPYPVNMLRNIARRAANTHFHLSADLEYTPSSGASKSFMDMIFKKLCPIDQATRGPKKPVCIRPHGSEDLMKVFHMLPEGIDYLQSVFIAPVYSIRKGAEPPETISAMRELARKGSAELEEYKDLYYFADSSAPYYDERFYWQPNGTHNIPRFYAICLREFHPFKLRDIFLYRYDLPTIPYLATAPYTDAASYLNNTILQLEYLNLYSRLHEGDCKACFAKRKKCIQ